MKTTIYIKTTNPDGLTESVKFGEYSGGNQENESRVAFRVLVKDKEENSQAAYRFDVWAIETETEDQELYNSQVLKFEEMDGRVVRRAHIVPDRAMPLYRAGGLINGDL